MELSKQITSLELSRKLRALGLKQESLFMWSSDSKLYIRWDLYMVDVEAQVLVKKSYFNDAIDFYSAFTVAEMGEILRDDKHAMTQWVDEENEMWCVHCEIDDGKMTDTRGALIHEEKAFTEADARAAMLQYLIEHALIDIDVVNKKMGFS